MKHYYFVAYGHSIRFSNKVENGTDACKNCYGMFDANRMCVVDVGSRSPKYFTNKQRQDFINQLRVRHKEKTGNDISI